MKHLLLTTIAAVLLRVCGGSIHDAARDGNIKAVEQHLASLLVIIDRFLSIG